MSEIMDGVHAIDTSQTLAITASATDVELVQEPLYSYETDNAGTSMMVLPDEEAEHVVVRVGWSSTGTGWFYLHNGDGVKIGQKVNFSANSGETADVKLKFGKGNPVQVDCHIVGGELNLYVEKYTRGAVFRVAVAEYLDA